MTRWSSMLLGLAAALSPAALTAQMHTPEPSMPRHGMDMEHLLFPAELVMQHQRDLGLTAQQRTAITEAVKALQSGVVDHQWQLRDEQQKLQELLARPTVEEAAALAQVDKVLELERTIKRLHLVMLVRIRNALTPEQHERLRTLHGEHGKAPGHLR